MMILKGATPGGRARLDREELTVTFDQLMAMDNLRWQVRLGSKGRNVMTARYGSIDRVMVDCRDYSWRNGDECRVYLPGHWETGEPERLVAIFMPGGDAVTADGVHYYWYRRGIWCRKRP